MDFDSDMGGTVLTVSKVADPKAGRCYDSVDGSYVEQIWLTSLSG